MARRSAYDIAVKAAGIRPLHFHDLRHPFGTRVIAKADIRRVQDWMGHADVQTTMKHLHYVPRPNDAALVAEAFAVEPAGRPPRAPDCRGSRPSQANRSLPDGRDARSRNRLGAPQGLATVGLNDDRARELIRRSAEVATAEIPQALGEAFRLREEWSEQDLLDTPAAIETPRLLTVELPRSAPNARRSCRARRSTREPRQARSRPDRQGEPRDRPQQRAGHAVGRAQPRRDGRGRSRRDALGQRGLAKRATAHRKPQPERPSLCSP
jgi:hypothetical protein